MAATSVGFTRRLADWQRIAVLVEALAIETAEPEDSAPCDVSTVRCENCGFVIERNKCKCNYCGERCFGC